MKIHHRRNHRKVIWEGDADFPLVPGTPVNLNGKIYEINGHYVDIKGDVAITRVEVKG